MESLDQEDYAAKDKAFYNAMVSAWLSTRLERDKQLLGLSVTAIGLLVTLLRTVGVSELSQIILFGLTLFAFLVTVVSIIYILGENSAHIEKMLKSSETESKILLYLDKVAGISFIIGMVLIVVIGMHSAVINLNQDVIVVSKEKTFSSHQSTNNDSWNGVAKLRPQPPKPDQSNSSNTSNTTNSSSITDGNDSHDAGASGGGN